MKFYLKKNSKIFNVVNNGLSKKKKFTYIVKKFLGKGGFA